MCLRFNRIHLCEAAESHSFSSASCAESNISTCKKHGKRSFSQAYIRGVLADSVVHPYCSRCSGVFIDRARRDSTSGPRALASGLPHRWGTGPGRASAASRTCTVGKIRCLPSPLPAEMLPGMLRERRRRYAVSQPFAAAHARPVGTL